MLARLFFELGPWNWMVLGLVLLGLEIVVPGVYLLWIGVAALLTGALTIQLWHWDLMTWQIQALVFIALSLLTVWGGRRIFGGAEHSDQPLLNRRREQLIGLTAVLDEPIREGNGRIRLGDTLWRVKGPDLPAGSRVRVTGVEDTRLVVAEA
jgi:inner membrane protein